jgi:hypothetical protein
VDRLFFSLSLYDADEPGSPARLLEARVVPSFVGLGVCSDFVVFLKDFRKRSGGNEVDYGWLLPFWQRGDVEYLSRFQISGQLCHGFD